MDFYTFGLSLDPHAVHQRHVLYDDSDEEDNKESLPLDPLLQITPEVVTNFLAKMCTLNYFTVEFP